MISVAHLLTALALTLPATAPPPEPTVVLRPDDGCAWARTLAEMPVCTRREDCAAADLWERSTWKQPGIQVLDPQGRPGAGPRWIVEVPSLPVRPCPATSGSAQVGSGSSYRILTWEMPASGNGSPSDRKPNAP